MSQNNLHILIVEDSEMDAELCLRELSRTGLDFVTERVWTREAFENALHNFVPDIVLCDFSLPGAFDGLTALDILRKHSSDSPFIFVSGTIGEERAVEAMKRGATDYVLKERMERLAPVVKRALQEAKERATLKYIQEALRESEERFRQLAENIHDVFFLIDAHDQRLLYVSPAYEEIWGESCTSLYANPAAWNSAIHPDDREGARHFLTNKTPSDRLDLQYRILRPDGTLHWIHDRRFPILDKSGQVQRVAGVASDITLRKKAEDRIARLNRIYAVLSGINTLIVRASNRDELLREACRISIDPGRFRVAWIGLMDQDNAVVQPVASSGDVGDLFDAMPLRIDKTKKEHNHIKRAILSGKPSVSNDIKNDPISCAKTRELVDHGINSLAVVPLLIGNQTIGVLALYATDIGTFDNEEIRLLTELAGDISFALDYLSKGEKLNYLAFYDALTGLPNRALFTERLNHQLSLAAQNGTKVALVMGDVKRFRLINQSMGRQSGDTLLREIAARAKHIWPAADSVAHINADCFAGTLVDIRDEATIAHTLEKALKTVTDAPFKIGEKDLLIGMTAGIAVYPTDGEDAENLFKNAEAALKKAKLSGEYFLFYQPEMNSKVAETLLLENKMRLALEKEQFLLHYQPKIDLSTGRVCGVEALIRWNDPATGLVPPEKFIPILEETGLILDVGTLAIRQAIADYQNWEEQGLKPPRIAVNVSVIQLRKKDFVDTLRAAIADANVARHGLDLEITESLIMEDIEGNIEKLEALRNMGINVAIDDFGTGYSSLSYLARLPVQFIKIDRSFIMTMTNNADSMTIVSTIISLAHSLKLKVIAEGVETEEQSRMLKLLKCDQMQGYLFSKPLPFDAITALLNKS